MLTHPLDIVRVNDKEIKKIQADHPKKKKNQAYLHRIVFVEDGRSGTCKMVNLINFN